MLSNLQTEIVTLTSAQVKSLRATPITIVPAQGAGTVILPIQCLAKLNYGGTNQFTNGQFCELKYNNGSGLQITGSFINPAFVQANSDQYTFTYTIPLITNSGSTGVENQALVIHNKGASEISGNAANNNSITIAVTYQVLNL